MTERTQFVTGPAGEAAAADHRWLHLLNALLLLGLWAFTILAYASLPELVPGHIGPSGVTRWEARHNSMWFIVPLLGSVHAVMMYGLSTLANSSPASFNVPDKKRLLALPPEGQRYALEPMRGFMFRMATWLLVLILYVQYSFYRVAVEAQTGEPRTGTMLPAILLLTAAVIVMAIRSSREVKHRVTAWESRANPT
jgi:uncharacterized membrane protein